MCRVGTIGEGEEQNAMEKNIREREARTFEGGATPRAGITLKRRAREGGNDRRLMFLQ